MLNDFLRHLVRDDDGWHTIQQGISLGCPLSPLLGALCLKPLDDSMVQTGLFYVRFMDDWIVLSPTRWKLRRAVAAVNRTLEALHLDKHPDKTFIGRTTAGFDFLGYHLRLVDGEGTLEADPPPISIRLKEKACALNQIPEFIVASATWAEALDQSTVQPFNRPGSGRAQACIAATGRENQSQFSRQYFPAL